MRIAKWSAAAAAFVVTVSLGRRPRAQAPQAPAAAAAPREPAADAVQAERRHGSGRDGREHPEDERQVFSFAELGFQEFETTKYLTGILEQNGFKIERGVAGIPTAWTARWGSGKPVIALGSDIDCIPQASQKPGVAYHDPIIEGAPGHGEGHNSGMPLQIAAALAVKKVMEQQHLPGTLMLWPGIAEELRRQQGVLRPRRHVQGRRHLDLRARRRQPRRRAGATATRTAWCRCEYNFKGESAHAAGGAVARPLRARRRRTDGRRLELPPRASPPPAALALRDHQRRRSAERRPAERLGLVLLPRDRLPAHQGAVGDRRQDGARRRR